MGGDGDDENGGGRNWMEIKVVNEMVKMEIVVMMS